MTKRAKRQKRQAYQWSSTQQTPGGTRFQTGVVGDKTFIRKQKTTPGGKTKVLHQYCAEPESSSKGEECKEGKVCRSCHRKNSEADRNARRRKTSGNKDIFGDRDESQQKEARKKARQDHHSEHRDAINSSRREVHGSRADAINASRRQAHGSKADAINASR